MSSNAMLAIGALLFFTMMNLMKFHTQTQPAKKTLLTAGEVAQHIALQEKLSKYKKSFRISNDNNRNRYVGLSKIWTEFIYTKGAEVGVWKGDFSKYMLENMPTLTSYVLVDSWRHLDNWNKPWVSSEKIEGMGVCWVCAMYQKYPVFLSLANIFMTAHRTLL